MPEPRLDILSLPHAVHGGALSEQSTVLISESASNVEFSGQHLVSPIRKLTDFSTCVNAFGVAPSVRSAVINCNIEEYPDRECRMVRAIAANIWKRPTDEIAFGAGSCEFIQAICTAFLTHGDAAVIATPAFGEYARAVILSGAHPLYASSIEEIIDFLRNAKNVRIVFVASPTSPTGNQIPKEDLVAIAEECRKADVLMVLDQAYDSFADAPHGTPAIPGHSYVVHLRSITKDHALAGIRAGFAIALPQVIRSIETARVPWAASSVAQTAAIAALQQEGMSYAKRTIKVLKQEADRVRNELVRVGFEVAPSDTHYMLVHVGDAATAKAFLLNSHNILVRDCTSFGLSSFVRIAARKESENDSLIAGFEDFMDFRSKHSRLLQRES